MKAVEQIAAVVRQSAALIRLEAVRISVGKLRGY
jgi:hypothetical protein